MTGPPVEVGMTPVERVVAMLAMVLLEAEEPVAVLFMDCVPLMMVTRKRS